MVTLKHLNLNSNKIIQNLTFIYLALLFLFGRTFMGIYIFNFRLGEIMIGVSAVLFVFYLISDSLNKNKKKYFKNINYHFLAITFHFVFLNFYYFNNFIDLYIFKASSYIWVLGAFYFGMNIFNNKISKTFLLILFSIVFSNYFISIFGISDNLQQLIGQYTDKVDYLKASDLLIFNIFFNYLLKRNTFFKTIDLNLIIFTFGVFYLPLIMNRSRGASLGLILYLVIILYEILKSKHKLNILLFLIVLNTLLFILSTFIVTKTKVVVEEIEERVVYITTGRFNTPPPESTEIVYPIIYFNNGRIFSGDGNFNWRLQIWQDVIEDLYKKKKIIVGYGYQDKIPAMNDELRAGNDGTNENVHNFLINILARGGIVHLIIYISFIITLIKYFKKSDYRNEFYMIVLSIFITSLFDSSMENSHFPILFYIIIGNMMTKENYNDKVLKNNL